MVLVPFFDCFDVASHLPRKPRPERDPAIFFHTGHQPDVTLVLDFAVDPDGVPHLLCVDEYLGAQAIGADCLSGGYPAGVTVRIGHCSAILRVCVYSHSSSWSDWLLNAAVALTRPFGVTLDLADRQPWRVMERHFSRVEHMELFGGFAFLAVGEND